VANDLAIWSGDWQLKTIKVSSGNKDNSNSLPHGMSKSLSLMWMPMAKDLSNKNMTGTPEPTSYNGSLLGA